MHQTNKTTISIMAENKNPNTDKAQLFKEKAATYTVCFNEHCNRRETCLRWILREYIRKDTLVQPCINLLNTQVASGACPMYRSDTPCRMPYGLISIYRDMPGRMERGIKNHLIHKYSRKRYYEYHNGTRPMTPDVEAYVRQTLKNFGWHQEPTFLGYVVEYVW